MGRVNWRWPAGPGKDVYPWYVIAWRFLWISPFYVGKAITWVSIAAVDGPGEATDWWRQQTWL